MSNPFRYQITITSAQAQAQGHPPAGYIAPTQYTYTYNPAMQYCNNCARPGLSHVQCPTGLGVRSAIPRYPGAWWETGRDVG